MFIAFIVSLSQVQSPSGIGGLLRLLLSCIGPLLVFAHKDFLFICVPDGGHCRNLSVITKPFNLFGHPMEGIPETCQLSLSLLIYLGTRWRAFQKRITH